MLNKLYWIIGLNLIPLFGFCQLEKSDTLYTELKVLDSLLFEEGFNKCRLTIVDSIVSANFEFYHDQNGIQDKPLFLKGFRESLKYKIRACNYCYVYLFHYKKFHRMTTFFLQNDPE